MRNRIGFANGSLCTGLLLALARGVEQSPAEEQSNHYDTDKVDAQRPPGLRITAGADTMNGDEDIDAQRQNMQTPPPGVANAGAQPGADADGNAKVQCDDAKSHPFGTIMACKGNEYLVPTETSEWVYPHRQHMHNHEDRAEQRQKVMQFAIDQARPAAGRL